MLDAARAAYVDHFVRTLADGYDTVLDDEASNVSAGEKNWAVGCTTCNNHPSERRCAA